MLTSSVMVGNRLLRLPDPALAVGVAPRLLRNLPSATHNRGIDRGDGRLLPPNREVLCMDQVYQDRHRALGDRPSPTSPPCTLPQFQPTQDDDGNLRSAPRRCGAGHNPDGPAVEVRSWPAPVLVHATAGSMDQSPIHRGLERGRAVCPA